MTKVERASHVDSDNGTASYVRRTDNGHGRLEITVNEATQVVVNSRHTHGSCHLTSIGIDCSTRRIAQHHSATTQGISTRGVNVFKEGIIELEF